MTTATDVANVLTSFLQAMRECWPWLGLIATMTLTIHAGAQETEPGGSPSRDASPAQSGSSTQLPEAANVDTTLPLQVVLTPLHWGRLSLLSFTAYEGYDTNPQLQQLPVGSSVTALSALAVYSIRRGHSELDLQYKPFVWISPRQTYKDLSGTAADFQHVRNLNPNWSLSVAERFRYSPDMQNSVQVEGFSVDFGGGTTAVAPFLSSGRNFLLNTVTASLNDQVSEESSLEFHANQNFTRISGSLGNQLVDIPAQEEISYGGGSSWTRHLDLRDTFRAGYDYRRQYSPDSTFGSADYHVLNAGWVHLFAPSVAVAADAGPAWFNTAGSGSAANQWHTTFRGSLQISKQFHSGGIALSASRSNDFTGATNNSFNNRYDLRVERGLRLRWKISTSVSYIQQGLVGARGIKGELGTGECDYFVSRNWSVFAQLRYLNITGGIPSFAPEKVAALGVRWAWKPEKP